MKLQNITLQSSIFIALVLMCAPRVWSATCVVQSSQLAPHMPPIRNQDGAAFCYSFAATALIEQWRCSNKNGCQYGYKESKEDSQIENPTEYFANMPDERLSVLDVARQSNPADAIARGGAREQALLAVQRSREVALEKCAPFDVLLNEELLPPIFTMSSAQLSSLPWFEAEKFYKKNKPNIESECQICQEDASELRESLKIKSSLKDILAALKDSKDFTQFARKIFLPKSCDRQKVSIPKYEVNQRYGPNTNEHIEKLKVLLAQGRPVGTSVCLENCRPHSIVIEGHREICCKGVCRSQYKAYDSFGLIWAKNEEGWIEEELLSQKMTNYHTWVTDWRKRNGIVEDVPIIQWIAKDKD